MSKFFNRVRQLTATTGTGDTITLGAATGQEYFTLAEAGATAGDTTVVVVEQGSDVAIYRVTVGTAAGSINIDAVLASKIGGTAGTSRLDLAGSAIVWCAVPGEEMDALRDGRNVVRTERGDAAYSILSADRFVAVTAAFTAPRTFTLPAASAVAAGTRIRIGDEAGGVSGTNTLTIARSGSDTIDGATTLVLDRAYEHAEIVSNGDDAWTVDVVGLTRGGIRGRTAADVRRLIGLNDTDTPPAVGDAWGWNGVIWVPRRVREVLTANRTYYVRTDGSDSNDGLSDSSGGALLTPQAAWNTLAALDLSTYSATIQIRDGTNSGGINAAAAPVGGSGIIIRGNESNPENVIIGNSAATGINIGIACAAPVTVRDMELRGTLRCLAATHPASIILTQNTRLGGAPTFSHIHVNHGRINIVGPSTVIGNSPRWLAAENTAVFIAGNTTITMSGTPAWSSEGILFTGNAFVSLFNITFSGGATGKRYTGSLNGTLNSFGAGSDSTYFPGNSNGTVATGAHQA